MSTKNNMKQPRVTVHPACRQIVGPREIADALTLLPGSPAEKVSRLNIWSNGKFPDDSANKSLMNKMVYRIFLDDATTELADIDRMAQLMGFSIFDATIPVINQTFNLKELMELVLAAFHLGKPQIFAWLIERAMNEEIVRLRSVTQAVISRLEYFPDGDIQQKMAVTLLRGQLKLAHEADGIDTFLANPYIKWHAQPFGATILSDFRAEICAAREKLELEELLTIRNDYAIDAPAVTRNVRAGPIRM